MKGNRTKQRVRTAVLALAAAGMILPFAPGVPEAAAATPEPTVYINGRIASGEVLVRKGVAYLTLTDLRALGDYTFRYDKTWRTVTIRDGEENDTYVLTLGSTNAKRNGQTIRIDAAPLSYLNKTMLPVRVAADLLGARLRWDKNSGRILISRASPGASSSGPSAPARPPVSPPGPSGPSVPKPPTPPSVR